MEKRAPFKWTARMEEAYEAALLRVGGLDTAKPRSVLDELIEDFPELTLENVKRHMLSHRRRVERHREMEPAGIQPPTKWAGRLQEAFELHVAHMGGMHSARPKQLLEALQPDFPELTLLVVKRHLTRQRAKLAQTQQAQGGQGRTQHSGEESHTAGSAGTRPERSLSVDLLPLCKRPQGTAAAALSNGMQGGIGGGPAGAAAAAAGQLASPAQRLLQQQAALEQQLSAVKQQLWLSLAGQGQGQGSGSGGSPTTKGQGPLGWEEQLALLAAAMGQPALLPATHAQAAAAAGLKAAEGTAATGAAGAAGAAGGPRWHPAWQPSPAWQPYLLPAAQRLCRESARVTLMCRKVVLCLEQHGTRLNALIHHLHTAAAAATTRTTAAAAASSGAGAGAGYSLPLASPTMPTSLPAELQHTAQQLLRSLSGSGGGSAAGPHASQRHQRGSSAIANSFRTRQRTAPEAAAAAAAAVGLRLPVLPPTASKQHDQATCTTPNCRLCAYELRNQRLRRERETAAGARAGAAAGAAAAGGDQPPPQPQQEQPQQPPQQQQPQQQLPPPPPHEQLQLLQQLQQHVQQAVAAHQGAPAAVRQQQHLAQQQQQQQQQHGVAPQQQHEVDQLLQQIDLLEGMLLEGSGASPPQLTLSTYLEQGSLMLEARGESPANTAGHPPGPIPPPLRAAPLPPPALLAGAGLGAGAAAPPPHFLPATGQLINHLISMMPEVAPAGQQAQQQQGELAQQAQQAQQQGLVGMAGGGSSGGGGSDPLLDLFLQHMPPQQRQAHVPPSPAS